MSRNTKIVVGIIAGILGVCCIIAIVAALVLPGVFEDFAEGFEDPEAGAELAGSIVDYDLPPGYEEIGAMNLFVMEVAMISGTDQRTAIMLAEFSDVFTGSEEDMQQQMRDAFATQTGGQNVNLEFVGSEDVTINGQEVALGTYEGIDEQGNSIRQIIGVFETKSGNSGMLMIFGPRDNWDERGINQFLDSLE
ncbi:hypothetical protein [Candidatus Leptofilum sp.]|uniref:hypothetical protein n=1 Tax=Candidatus Leptofilum sp. TaxID=3241576 RepID=UPI003B5B2A19